MFNLNESGLKSIAKVVAGIAFFADLITIANFIVNLFRQHTATAFDKSTANIAVIVIVFLFAFALLLYSKNEFTSFDFAIWFFSWMYVLFAALILAIKSWSFFEAASYSFADLFGYILLISLIFGLGFSVSFVMGNFPKTFAVPFFAIALEQIALWVKNMLVGEFDFNVYFFGTMILFVFSGLLILFTLGHERIPNLLSILKR